MRAASAPCWENWSLRRASGAPVLSLTDISHAALPPTLTPAPNPHLPNLPSQDPLTARYTTYVSEYYQDYKGLWTMCFTIVGAVQGPRWGCSGRMGRKGQRPALCH